MPLPDWPRDACLAGFGMKTLQFAADYDGDVTATLVRENCRDPLPRGAVLYIHGFIDYFFQAHVAAEFRNRGYRFYGLDLRKYGRSLKPHPNFCRDFREYFAEIAASLEIIRGEGYEDVILLAHSTGALAALLYAKEHSTASISRIILNSPFLRFKEASGLVALAAKLGETYPFLSRSKPICRWYGESLHTTKHGEWDFDLRLKPLQGFPAYFGWIRAVVQVQTQIASGLKLPQRILVLHSDRTLGCGWSWREKYHRGDLVLNPADMIRLSPKLGNDVTVIEIAGGKHDLTLSCRDVRPSVFDAMFNWLQA